MNEYKFLDNINDPADLRTLPEKDLPILCEELRQFLLEVVSEVGGHLSSSLGAVELTVALHYVLNTPGDRLVWDVGHQAYIHKILTGRKESFNTIRQYGGISGFLKPAESEYDVYGAGHASTAISAAWGMAMARDIKGGKNRIAAIFGDGALTGGICYEAINNAGNSGTPFLAILNDNQMSISPNVGAINHYLTNFATTPLYQTFRRRVRDSLEMVPRLGKPMTHLARRLEEAAKHVLTPGALFEALGFDYYGPVNGHDVKTLVNSLRNLKDQDRPVLLHVITTKGKGYRLAEEEPENYHGVKPFCQVNGIQPSKKGSLSFQDAFGKILVELAERDDRIIGITAAMPAGTGIKPFANAFPKRFFDVGIAEEHAVIFACGLATEGLKPVCAIYSTFLQRAYDPIVHDAALQKLPVVFCMDRAGLAGEDGPTHHGTFDISYLRHIPNLVLGAPKNGTELRNMMATAIAHEDGPFAIRYPKAAVGEYDTGGDPEILPIGSWEVCAPGEEILLLATGSMVPAAEEAGEILREEGVFPEVVNCRFIKPLDRSYLAKNLNRFSHVVTVEENAVAGGFGSAILEYAHSEDLRVPIKLMGIPDRFIPHGARSKLLEDVGLTSGAIADVVRGIVRVQRLRGVKRPSLA